MDFLQSTMGHDVIENNRKCSRFNFIKLKKSIVYRLTYVFFETYFRITLCGAAILLIFPRLLISHQVTGLSNARIGTFVQGNLLQQDAVIEIAVNEANRLCVRSTSF